MTSMEMSNGAAGLFDAGILHTMGAIAEQLCHASVLPEHLRGSGHGPDFKEYPLEVRRANCLLIVNAARLFQMDPFMLANESHVIYGRWDMSGKCYAAVYNAHGGGTPLKYTYEGDGDQLRLTVSGCPAGHDEPRELTVRLVDAQTYENSGAVKSAWKKPEQQLAYYGARQWVRRYAPECLLGLVKSADDVDEATEIHQPATQAALEDSAPSGNFYRLWKAADGCTHQMELKPLSLKVEAATLKPGERDKLLVHLRERWRELSQPTIEAPRQQQPDDTAPERSEAFSRWERTIKTEHDAKLLSEYRATIGSDKDVTDDEAMELDQMIEQQSKSIVV